MRSTKLWLTSGALAVGLGVSTLVPLLRGQPAKGGSSGVQQQEQQGQEQPGQQQQQQKVQTFVGQVVKARNGRYALLTDKQAGKGFYLDNQEKAKQFDGQNVKVTGELDVATNTIRVSNIQPA